MQSSYIDNSFGNSNMRTYDDIDATASRISQRARTRSPRSLKAMSDLKSNTNLNTRFSNLNIQNETRENRVNSLFKEKSNRLNNILEKSRLNNNLRNNNIQENNLERRSNRLNNLIENNKIQENNLERRSNRLNNILQKNIEENNLERRSNRLNNILQKNIEEKRASRLNTLRNNNIEENVLNSRRNEENILERRSNRLNNILQNDEEKLNNTFQRNAFDLSMPSQNIDTDLMQSVNDPLFSSKSERLNRTLQRKSALDLSMRSQNSRLGSPRRMNRSINRQNFESEANRISKLSQLEADNDELDELEELEELPIVSRNINPVQSLYQSKIKDSARQSDRTIDQFFNRSKPAKSGSPILEYDNNLPSSWTLKFRLPGNIIVSHKFDKQEPLESIVQQIKHDLKYDQGIVLILPPSQIITCPLDTPISECGIENYKMITVTKA